jgi:hypothetical protein
MKKLSLIYNLDSRPGWLDVMTSTAQCNGGCRSIDFFTHGLWNKLEFLQTPLLEMEVFIYIDEHQLIPDPIFAAIDEICKIK